jgi:hypothetical protein
MTADCEGGWWGGCNYQSCSLTVCVSVQYYTIVVCRRWSFRQVAFDLVCFVAWWFSRAMYLHVSCKHCGLLYRELYQVHPFPCWTESCKSCTVSFAKRWPQVSRNIGVNWWTHRRLASRVHYVQTVHSSLGDRFMHAVPLWGMNNLPLFPSHWYLGRKSSFHQTFIAVELKKIHTVNIPFIYIVWKP